MVKSGDIRERLIEFVNINKKPVSRVEAGDIVILDASGHCGARCINSVVFLDRKHLKELKQMIRQYEDWVYRNDSDTCEQCGLPLSLQWQRFIVKEVTLSDIEQARELNIDIDDLYRELYTV